VFLAGRGAIQYGLLKRREFITMSSTQPGRIGETRRHLHYVLRTGNPEPRTPMLDSVERWNWAVRISVVGLFVVALAVIAFKMASVVVPVVLAWVVAMVLLPVVDGLERRGLSRALTSIVLVVLLIASIMVIVGVLTVPLTYWVGRASELGALLKERLQTLGNPFAFFDEIGNALSQVTGGDKSASDAVKSFLFQYCNCDPLRADARGQRNSDFSGRAGLQPDLPSRYSEWNAAAVPR
jgi:hypothetical protein